MALVLKKMYQTYFWIINEMADPRSKHLPLASPIAPIVIVCVYMYFVKILGPKLMENRKPFQIKNLLKAYNIIQIVGNAYLFYRVLTRMLKMSWTCALIDYSNSASGLEDMHLSYYYYLLKLLDLLDTVFFVLRKSYRQVSFLHTYHHCGMVLAIWIGFRFLPGGNGGWIPLLNCAVHVVMFIYYYLTAASDKWKENVMFKKALTQLQLVQFAILLIVFGRIFFQPDCKYPIFVSYLFVPQNAFMMLLFGDFYLKAYVFKKINKSESINKKE